MGGNISMNDTMKYNYLETSSLIPYARNTRTHTSEQITQIANSIKEFGFLNPVIIDGNNGIIAGHARVQAAQRLGLEDVPTIDAGHLTNEQKRAYIIADNKLALNAEWDDNLLKIELKELEALNFDLNLTGFNLGELTDLFFDPNFDAGSKDEQGKLDELDPKIINCPHCGQDFDLRKHE